MKTMKEYFDFKHNFIQEHGGLESVDTSPMDEYSCYHKVYTCSDGAMLHESNGPVWYDVDVMYNVNGAMVYSGKRESKKFFRTESWNSVNSKSEYYIEAWN